MCSIFIPYCQNIHRIVHNLQEQMLNSVPQRKFQVAGI